MSSSSGGEAIRIEMLGDDTVQAKELGDRIVSAISNIEGVRGAMVDIDESNRELQVYVQQVYRAVGLHRIVQEG